VAERFATLGALTATQRDSVVKPTLLVTGANGFIGRATAAHGMATGLNVFGLVRSMPPPSQQLSGVTYLVADITDKRSLARSLDSERFDFIINLAGSVDHRPFMDGGRSALDQHFSGLVNILELCRHDALKGFVQVGSSDEYGGLPAPQQEDSREQPISCYAAAKSAATMLVEALARTEGFPGRVARLFLVYGPGQADNRFIPQIIRGCLADSVFPVSAGRQQRDFCYIDDVAAGLVDLVRLQENSSTLFNLASGNGVSIHSVVKMIQQMVGAGSPGFGEIPYRAGENMALYADISRISATTGWRPAVALEDGLRQTIRWYRDKL